MRVPAGVFQIGCVPADPDCLDNERPRHEVSLRAFAMSKFEITFAEYQRFARAVGRKLPDRMGLDESTHPVVSMRLPGTETPSR